MKGRQGYAQAAELSSSDRRAARSRRRTGYTSLSVGLEPGVGKPWNQELPRLVVLTERLSDARVHSNGEGVEAIAERAIGKQAGSRRPFLTTGLHSNPVADEYPLGSFRGIFLFFRGGMDRVRGVLRRDPSQVVSP